MTFNKDKKFKMSKISIQPIITMGWKPFAWLA